MAGAPGVTGVARRTGMAAAATARAIGGSRGLAAVVRRPWLTVAAALIPRATTGSA